MSYEFWVVPPMCSTLTAMTAGITEETSAHSPAHQEAELQLERQSQITQLLPQQTQLFVSTFSRSVYNRKPSSLDQCLSL
ncbi:hypothetical protein EGR_06931 [Echinococcus granulosus]|uniref:Uncharacterized protein n=1 Tax=Echinococcus granulosus TaxID=6210 RepID=W6UJ58_ECHGR|nr:hypothetical protein EGR_06931 [Echinococcus granulosus]EUB58187.1 hypothetical protein EGR_06931 [Echinococcus granulosus]